MRLLHLTLSVILVAKIVDGLLNLNDVTFTLKQLIKRTGKNTNTLLKERLKSLVLRNNQTELVRDKNGDVTIKVPRKSMIDLIPDAEASSKQGGKNALNDLIRKVDKVTSSITNKKEEGPKEKSENIKTNTNNEEKEQPPDLIPEVAASLKQGEKSVNALNDLLKKVDKVTSSITKKEEDPKENSEHEKSKNEEKEELPPAQIDTLSFTLEDIQQHQQKLSQRFNPKSQRKKYVPLLPLLTVQLKFDWSP